MAGAHNENLGGGPSQLSSMRLRNEDHQPHQPYHFRPCRLRPSICHPLERLLVDQYLRLLAVYDVVGMFTEQSVDTAQKADQTNLDIPMLVR